MTSHELVFLLTSCAIGYVVGVVIGLALWRWWL